MLLLAGVTLQVVGVGSSRVLRVVVVAPAVRALQAAVFGRGQVHAAAAAPRRTGEVVVLPTVGVVQQVLTGGRLAQLVGAAVVDALVRVDVV